MNRRRIVPILALLLALSLPMAGQGGDDTAHCQPVRPENIPIEVPIVASSDDAGYSYTCSYGTTHNEVYLSGHCTSGQEIVSGWRLANVPVPKNTSIVDAYIRFTVDGPYTSPISVNFYGKASAMPNHSAIARREAAHRCWGSLPCGRCRPATIGRWERSTSPTRSIS